MSRKNIDWGFLDHLHAIAERGAVHAVGQFVLLRVVDAKRQWNEGDNKVIAATGETDPDNRETLAYEVLSVGEDVTKRGVVQGNIVFHAACAAEETIFAGDDTYVTVHERDITNALSLKEAQAIYAQIQAEIKEKKAKALADWEGTKDAGRVHV